MKKINIFLAIILLATLSMSGFLTYRYLKTEKLTGPDAPEETSLEDINQIESENIKTNANETGPLVPEISTETSNKTNDETDPNTPYPLTLNLEMPFYTQAPHSNWDYPWQEACEEASVVLSANLYNKLNLNLEDYNSELLNLVDWEVEYFGAYEHTTVAQTAEMLLLQYNLKSKIHENPTFEEIQAILNKGHLIIAPFAGKLLENPNFRNGGPNYHMLVIKGYDANKMQIVTHDVGTRNGANYVYTWSIIENALHDWHDNDMLLGEKLLIEVLAPETLESEDSN